MNFTDLAIRFPTQDDCKAYLAERRWPTGVKCPRCGNTKVGNSTKRWTCGGPCTNGKGKGGPYRFSVVTGTILGKHHYQLIEWIEIAFLLYQGTTREQIRRMFGSGSMREIIYCRIAAVANTAAVARKADGGTFDDFITAVLNATTALKYKRRRIVAAAAGVAARGAANTRAARPRPGDGTPKDRPIFGAARPTA